MLQMAQKFRRIFLSPKVNVDRVYSEEILLFVMFVIRADVPLSLTSN